MTHVLSVPIIPNYLIEREYPHLHKASERFEEVARNVTVLHLNNLTCFYQDEYTRHNIFKSRKTVISRGPDGYDVEFLCTNDTYELPEYTQYNTTYITVNYNKTVKEGASRPTTYTHAALLHENVKVGLMFASKSVVQMIINPMIGPLTNRFNPHARKIN